MIVGDPAMEASVCPPPKPLDRLPRWQLPAGTVDTHFHVFRAGAPLVTPRNYTPAIIGLEEWAALADAVGIAKGVVVQPSVYGFDNVALIEALKAAPDRLRGIVVLRPDVPHAELEELHRLGVRGVRINTRNLGGLAFETVRDLAVRIAPLGWMLEFQMLPEQVDALAGMAPNLGVPIIIDHMGFIEMNRSTTDATVRRLRALLDTGVCLRQAFGVVPARRHCRGFRRCGTRAHPVASRSPALGHGLAAHGVLGRHAG